MTKKAKTEEQKIAELYELKAVIDGWSSAEMRRHMRDEEIATAVENILSEVARLEGRQ